MNGDFEGLPHISDDGDVKTELSVRWESDGWLSIRITDQTIEGENSGVWTEHFVKLDQLHAIGLAFIRVEAS